MSDDEDGNDHICYFCLVFVLQGEAHESQGLVSFTGLPVEDDENEWLKDEPRRVELTIDTRQF